MTCPGSVVLSEGMPGDDSEYAAEGTRAHDMAEKWLLMYLAQHGTTPTFKTPEDIEMAKHVKVYVDECIGLTNAPGVKVHVEKKVAVNNDVYGTADFIAWHPETHTLYVRDLKYGAGVFVSVERSIQLRIYALAALLTMKLPAKTVSIGIVQPRYECPEGAVRYVDFDAADLLDIYVDVMDAVERTVTAGTTKGSKDWEANFLKPSEKGCRWCLAAPKPCPALLKNAQALAKQVFSIVPAGEVLAPVNGSTIATKPAYDPLALARALDFIPILEGWIKNTREFAYGEAEKGVDIPDYKLVDKTAVRKWKDEFDRVTLIRALGCGASGIYKPVELIGIGDAEKMAPGKNAKERAAVLEPFVKKESSGHTLVHVSDKRDPVRIDAKAAFALTSGESQASMAGVSLFD
jgi:hypothetical protein